MPQIYEIFNPYKTFVGIFIPNALIKYKGLSLSAKVCWGRLAQYAGKNGVCYPKQKTLANELGVSVRQIQNTIKELVDQGFIKKESPKGKNKWNHLNNKYYFLWHPCFEAGSQAIEDPKQTSGSDIELPFGSLPVTGLLSIKKEIHAELNHGKEIHIKSKDFIKRMGEPIGSRSVSTETLQTDLKDCLENKNDPNKQKEMFLIETTSQLEVNKVMFIGTESNSAEASKDKVLFIGTEAPAPITILKRRAYSDEKENALLQENPQSPVIPPARPIGFRPNSEQISIVRQKLKENPDMLKPDIKPARLIHPSSDVAEIINYWNSKKLKVTKEFNGEKAKQNDFQTESYKNMITAVKELLHGKVFSDIREVNRIDKRKYSVEEVKKTIAKFAIAALDSDYHPSGSYKEHLAKVSLETFIYSPRSVKDKSLFLRYLHEEPKLLATKAKPKLMKDEHQGLTRQITKRFMQYIYEFSPSIEEQNYFICAAKRIYDFREKEDAYVRTFGDLSGTEYSKWFIESIIWNTEKMGKSIDNTEVRWLDSDLTIQNFKRYLIKQGIYKKAKPNYYQKEEEEDDYTNWYDEE